MKRITITFGINDKNCIKEIFFDLNETDMPNDSKTLENLAITLLKNIQIDRGSLEVQDLLNELGIVSKK